MESARGQSLLCLPLGVFFGRADRRALMANLPALLAFERGWGRRRRRGRRWEWVKASREEGREEDGGAGVGWKQERGGLFHRGPLAAYSGSVAIWKCRCKTGGWGGATSQWRLKPMTLNGSVERGENGFSRSTVTRCSSRTRCKLCSLFLLF